MSAWIWSSDSFGARAARTALLPASMLFRIGSTIRNAAFDAGWLASQSLGAPAISVGNLSVGGTGKTPIAAWFAHEFALRGARPAILLRGYGGDEIAVHERLTPEAIVLADPVRTRGAAAAIARGADVLVLDDAFQHRRARRDADVVLVSADAHHRARHVLPAGPFRETMHALGRARMAIVTRKAASGETVDAVIDDVRSAAPNVEIAVMALAPSELVRWDGVARTALTTAKGRVTAVSAIGDPVAFATQLRAQGLDVEDIRYPDHHAYTPSDVADIVKRASGSEFVVCTLKDAVKLGPLWPRGEVPLWYLSQQVNIERGGEFIGALVTELVAARRDVRST